MRKLQQNFIDELFEDGNIGVCVLVRIDFPLQIHYVIQLNSGNKGMMEDPRTDIPMRGTVPSTEEGKQNSRHELEARHSVTLHVNMRWWSVLGSDTDLLLVLMFRIMSVDSTHMLHITHAYISHS